jgi:Putative DNA-binding domain
MPDVPDGRGLERLLGEAEGEHLECKLGLRDSRSAARVLAALGNSGGGVLVIGVREAHGVVGVADANDVTRRIEQATSSIRPQPEVAVKARNHGGKTVVVTVVSEAGGPFAAPDGTVAKRDSAGRQFLCRYRRRYERSLGSPGRKMHPNPSATTQSMRIFFVALRRWRRRTPKKSAAHLRSNRLPKSSV